MRAQPEVVSTRLDRRERAQIRALAELEGDTVCAVVRRLLVPAVRRRLVELAGEEPR